MSFSSRSSSRRKRPKSAPSHRPVRPKPSWDPTIQDLSVHRASPQDLVRRKHERISKNLLTKRTPPPESPKFSYRSFTSPTQPKFTANVDRTSLHSESDRVIQGLVRQITHTSPRESYSFSPVSPPPNSVEASIQADIESPQPMSSPSSPCSCNCVDEEVENRILVQVDQRIKELAEKMESVFDKRVLELVEPKLKYIEELKETVDGLQVSNVKLLSEIEILKKKGELFDEFLAVDLLPKTKISEKGEKPPSPKLIEPIISPSHHQPIQPEPLSTSPPPLTDQYQGLKSDDMSLLEHDLQEFSSEHKLPAPSPKPVVPNLQLLESQSMVSSDWIKANRNAVNYPVTIDQSVSLSDYDSFNLPPSSSTQSDSFKISKRSKQKAKIIKTTRKVPIVDCLRQSSSHIE
ncbi:hypothetical protein GEMRC1_001527 [Eukaryota sp. GEM-RC1]